MKIPPFWIKLRVVESGRKKIGLWVPLFIVGPIVLIFGIIAAPLVLLISLILWPSGKGRTLLLGLPLLIYLFCCMSGLRVNVGSGKNQVYINVK